MLGRNINTGSVVKVYIHELSGIVLAMDKPVSLYNNVIVALVIGVITPVLVDHKSVLLQTSHGLLWLEADNDYDGVFV